MKDAPEGAVKGKCGKVMNGDTVAAVSTPRGRGGVAVIRISGDGALGTAEKVFFPAGGKDVCEIAPRRATYGEVRDLDGRVVDRAVLTTYRGPASFTGEDVAEISCHGGVSVTRAVLEAVFAAGARPAEAGEFTKRSFINGKMTLSEAEAVGLLIDSDTEDRLRLSVGAAGGRLKNELRRITDRLVSSLSYLYAEIDYPDEEITDGSGRDGGEEVLDALREAESSLGRLLATFRRGSAVADGVKAAVVGVPNVGKSSLFNALCGDDGAIVTDMPGTTRDVLRRTVSLGGITVLLSDTAGLREAENEAESMGVERAVREMENAELLFAVFDGSRPLTDAERDMMKKYPAVPRIAVINKCDLEPALSGDETEEIERNHDITVRVSCLTGDGIAAVDRAVADLFDSDSVDLDSDAVIWDARQRADLTVAHGLVRDALAALESGDSADAVCTLCESAASKLGETDGRGVTEEIVNGIFSRFCVGK